MTQEHLTPYWPQAMQSQKKKIVKRANLEKILIIGGGSMLGGYFTVGKKLHRADLDITKRSQVESVIKREKPNVIVLLAAATNQRLCEENPSIAYRTNSLGALHVASAAAEIHATVVYISTNAVFDGEKKTAYRESDKPNPINHYGQSKYFGELAVEQSRTPFLIIRSSWIFGGGRKRDNRFVGAIVKQLKNPEMTVVSDNKGTPTYAKDLAQIIQKLISEKAWGYYHLANSGSGSRFEQAREITRYFHYKGKIRPVPLKTLDLGFNSPSNEALASSKIHLRSWKKALHEYLQTEWKNL